MLKLRTLTAVVLAGLLLLGLFVLAPQRTVFVFATLATVGAWEWAGFGGLHGGAARLAYACAIALLLLLSWLWTGGPKHPLILLGRGRLWGGITFLAVVVVPAFVAVARLAIAGNGFVRGPQIVLWLLLLVTGADIGAFFAGRNFGRC